MTKESARRSSCGPGVSGTNSSSTASASGGVRFSESPAWERGDDTDDWCRVRRGNQEDAFAVGADAKAPMCTPSLQSASFQRDLEGEEAQEEGFEDDADEGPRDEEVSAWLEESEKLLEDDEQHQQHERHQQQQQNDLPTALEALLDLELDVHNLPVLEDNNQFALQEQCDAFGEDDALSLELLLCHFVVSLAYTQALQSPHGKRQQWDELDPSAVPALESCATLLVPEELLTRDTKRHLHQTRIESSDRVPDLTSPSHHVAPFQPPPRHSADGDEYDLASPVGLPDTPNASQAAGTSRWDLSPDLRYEVDDAFFESAPPPPSVRTPSRSVAKKAQRHSSTRTPTGRTTIHTPARPLLPTAQAAAVASHQPQAHSQYQQQPASVPKRKVKHGGIYSLLLKNRGPGDHEPVLIDEKRSPEVPEGIMLLCVTEREYTSRAKHGSYLTIANFFTSFHAADSPGRARTSAPFSSKKSPPPPPATVGKVQHGSIYRMLRRYPNGS